MNLEFTCVAVPNPASDPNAVAVLGYFQTEVYFAALKPVVTSNALSEVKSPSAGTVVLDQVPNVNRAVVVTARCAMAHSHRLAVF